MLLRRRGNESTPVRLIWLTEPGSDLCPPIDRLKYTCLFERSLRDAAVLVHPNFTARKELGLRAFRKGHELVSSSTYDELAVRARVRPPPPHAVLLPHRCTASGKMLPFCLLSLLPDDPPLIVILNKVFDNVDLKLRQLALRQFASRIALLVSATPLVSGYAARLALPGMPPVPHLFLPYAASEAFGRYALDAPTELDVIPHTEEWLAKGNERLREELRELRSKRGAITIEATAPHGRARNKAASDEPTSLAAFLPYRADLGFSGGAGMLSSRYAFRASVLDSNSSVQHELRRLGVRFERPYFLPTDAYIRALATTRVWFATTERGEHASTRFFEVMISGRALLLCDRNPVALEPLGIVEGENAAMFNSTTELISTLMYYLQHEHERERLVRNARALALRRHLWGHRAGLLVRSARTALRQFTRRGGSSSTSMVSGGGRGGGGGARAMSFASPTKGRRLGARRRHPTGNSTAVVRLLRRSGAASSHHNQSRTCPLSDLSHLVHVACFMAADQPILARHFVRHYHTRVGVALGRMRFWVHAGPNTSDFKLARAAVDSLLEEGVGAEGSHTVPALFALATLRHYTLSHPRGIEHVL